MRQNLVPKPIKFPGGVERQIIDMAQLDAMFDTFSGIERPISDAPSIVPDNDDDPTWA